MKRIYEKPAMRILNIQNQTHLLSGSYKVNEYQRGNDIAVGDVDEWWVSRDISGRIRDSTYFINL